MNEGAAEEWLDIYAGQIPIEKYFVQVNNGEENGLVINLTGKEHQVSICFGVIHAVQMLDEGIELNLSDTRELGASFFEIRVQKFSSTLYLLRNGWFSQYIQTLMGEELFDALGCREYCIITENYSIYVVSSYEPEITVRYT